ncbi:MAG: choice-of-anchor D domain-containing protein [Bacteroidetes bacterium]|nr:choice-of-anchor D domain-containing protein [Bacteroidota bacterium]
MSSIGRDAVLRFAPGQCVEITDDAHELHSVPGTLVQVDSVEGNVVTVDPTTRLPAGGSIDMADFPLNPKVRRWDGIIENAANQSFQDLEDGVQVRFRGGNGPDGQPRRYHTSDYWMIPARTNTGDVEWPTEDDGWQAAFGIHHHYCRLALLTFADPDWTVLSDCRNLFPPVTELTSLFYVGGDGQETMPDDPELPHPLEVGVSSGQWPVEGATVRFEITEGAGDVDGAAFVEVPSSADGVARCTWTVDDSTQVQQVIAVLLNAAGDPVHLPIHFGANLSIADEVAYDPAADCTLPETVTTVQEALDELCRRGGIDEPGIHVEKIVLGNGEPLLNDIQVPVEDLVSGIQVMCEGEIIQASVQDKPVCYVTLYLPFPFNSADMDLWGREFVIGTRPLRLEAQVNSNSNVIFWKPTSATPEWLVNRLFQMMEQLNRGDRVLAYLTLKGNFIWSGEGEERLYLDGEVFGELRDDGSTNALLPSGNRLRGGDLEMWFWLVDGDRGRSGINVSPPDLDFGIVNVRRSSTITLNVSNTGNAPLVVTDLSMGQDDVYSADPATPFTVPAGSERSVTVRFEPGTQGEFLDSLTISSNDRQNPQVKVSLRGSGQLGLRAVPGIGTTFTARLEEAGITRADEVAAMDEEGLATVLTISGSRAATLITEARRLVRG